MSGSLVLALITIIGSMIVIAIAMVITFPLWIPAACRFAVGSIYQIDVQGLDQLPESGPVILAPNHVTWIDPALVTAFAPRRLRFLIFDGNVGDPFRRLICWRMGHVLVPETGPKAHREVLRRATAILDRGQMLVVFPEAQLTRNGRVGRFLRGLERLVASRNDVDIVPVALVGLWGSRFSFAAQVGESSKNDSAIEGNPSSTSRSSTKGRVVIRFGPPLRSPVTTFAIRQAVVEQQVRARANLRPVDESPMPMIAPSWVHPTLGRLTASAPDYDRDGIKQVGLRMGTLGQSCPNVALRVVDDEGRPQEAGKIGRVEVLCAGEADYRNTNARGAIDRDGFVTRISPD